MATLPLKQPRLDQTRTGASGDTELKTLTTGTPIKVDFAVLTNNELTLCGTDPVAISYLMTTGNAGVVPGETRYIVQRVHPSDTFAMTVYHSTTASAVLADADIDAQTQYGIIKATVDGVTAWAVDKEETGAVKVRVIGRQSDCTATDVFPRALVQFISSTCTFQS